MIIKNKQTRFRSFAYFYVRSAKVFGTQSSDFFISSITGATVSTPAPATVRIFPTTIHFAAVAVTVAAVNSIVNVHFSSFHLILRICFYHSPAMISMIPPTTTRIAPIIVNIISHSFLLVNVFFISTWYVLLFYANLWFAELLFTFIHLSKVNEI